MFVFVAGRTVTSPVCSTSSRHFPLSETRLSPGFSICVRSLQHGALRCNVAFVEAGATCGGAALRLSRGHRLRHPNATPTGARRTPAGGPVTAARRSCLRRSRSRVTCAAKRAVHRGACGAVCAVHHATPRTGACEALHATRHTADRIAHVRATRQRKMRTRHATHSVWLRATPGNMPDRVPATDGAGPEPSLPGRRRARTACRSAWALAAPTASSCSTSLHRTDRACSTMLWRTVPPLTSGEGVHARGSRPR